MALGMQGMFIVHPRTPQLPKVDRDYCIMLHNFAVHAGTATPDPSVMTDFNMWTFNSRVFPGIDPMVARTGDRVRIRVANLSMHEHPIHIHGTAFEVTGTDAGWIPQTARYKETTMLVPVGNIRVGGFIADYPGDWAMHCHKSHHTMNAMGHDIPNMLGVPHSDLARRIRTLVPGYMMMGEGPFGPIEMGGMFTTMKIRDDQGHDDYGDPGWYEHPAGTVAWKLEDSANG